MSEIRQTMNEAVKTSMKARELEKVKVLRNVQAVIKQIEIDRQVTLDDKAVLEILQKQIKQRQESLAVFTANGREDLAEKERFEIAVIQDFMPEPLSDEELLALVKAEIINQEATSLKDMGKIMNALKDKTAGRADSAVISKFVKECLQG